ncbi:MAG: hypothetical protein ACK5XV_06915 [Flavobacteriales bacterium]|jgi:tetratricopeptide (TPR) repeat protein
MANKASDQLHRLIHSMTKAEKRYFKVYSSRHNHAEDNNYQVLFDAIDRQPIYDEARLLRKLADKALTHRFSIAKNRLYNAILRSLDSFHTASNREAQLYRQIHAAAILYHKALYDQSMKLLEGARKVAMRYECLPILAEISQWEKKILERSQYEDIRHVSELEDRCERDRVQNEQLAVVDELWNLKSLVFHQLYRQGKARSGSEWADLDELLHTRLSPLVERARSVRARYLVLHIRSAVFFGKGQYEACYPHLTENLALMESQEELFADEPSSYLSVLTNAMYVGMRIGQRKEAFRMMDKLRAFRSRPEWEQHEDFRLRLFSIGVSAELALFAQSGEFESGLTLRQEIEDGLSQYGELLSSLRHAHFCFNLAVCYFGTGQYAEAQRWLHRLTNEVPIDLTRDLHCMGQLFNLVVYHERGDERMLPYALRSAQRFMETRGKVHGVEQAILQFIHDSTKKRKQSDMRQRFAELAHVLAVYREDPHEKLAFEFFDFHAWAMSKATGKSYRELLAA